MRPNVDSPLRRAFTLIELLVVVAIIGLLISILLPSLNRAKRQARQLICITNLRALGEAASFYAEENKDYLPRAIQGWEDNDEYHIFATAIIKYLGYQGDLEFGVTSDTNKLWNDRNLHRRNINRILRNIPVLHCPDFPHDTKPNDQHTTLSPLDYAASAFPIPYPESSINSDTDLEWDAEGSFQGESGPGYISSSKLEQIPAGVSPTNIIYVTEVHTSVPWKGHGPRYHHFFLASQLPFGGHPRIANDQRHPAGICALFFDGHAQTMEFHNLDVGYPNPLDKRLKYFTIMPDGYDGG